MRPVFLVVVLLGLAVTVEVTAQPPVGLPPPGLVFAPRPPPPPSPLPAVLPAVLTPLWALPLVLHLQEQQREHEAEEEEGPMHADPSGAVEYKIIRSAGKVFKDPAKFRAALAEEARAGWELAEKLDDGRARLRRPVACREQDAGLEQDAYRTQVGPGETAIVFRSLGIAFGVIAVLAVVAVGVIAVLSK